MELDVGYMLCKVKIGAQILIFTFHGIMITGHVQRKYA